MSLHIYAYVVIYLLLTFTLLMQQPTFSLISFSGMGHMSIFVFGVDLYCFTNNTS